MSHTEYNKLHSQFQAYILLCTRPGLPGYPESPLGLDGVRAGLDALLSTLYKNPYRYVEPLVPLVNRVRGIRLLMIIGACLSSTNYMVGGGHWC